MAVLTWQNVNAPDLSGAAQVIGRNGQNIGSAFNDLAAGLGAFNQARQDRADAAAIQAASQITDSAAYTQALKDGSILRNAGIDPNMISGRAAELLAARQKTLLGNDFNQAQIENQRADNEMALKRFEAEQDQRVIDNERSGYRFKREQDRDTRADQLLTDEDAARQLMFAVNQAGTDQAGARQMVMGANVSDRVKQSVLGSLGLGGGVIKLSQPGSAGAPSRGADSWWGSTGDNPGGIQPDRPLSQGTFGEAHDFGQRLIPATRGQVGAGPDKGTSAVGAYQMIGDTMERYASKVLGKDWRDQAFTFENQSKVAEAIFNDLKGGNLKAVWASLPDATPGAYKNMSWEEFQREVLPRESGVTLEEARAQSDQTRIGQVKATSQLVGDQLSQAANQRLGNIELDRYMKDLENDNPRLADAAAKAIKENPALKGTDLGTVSNWIATIQKKAASTKTPMSASAATHVLAAALRPDRGFWDFNAGPDAESGFKFDEKLVDQTLRDINSGDVAGRAAVARDTASDRDKLAASLKALEAAEKDQERIRQADAAGNPVSQSVRNDAATALSKALKRVEETNAAINQKQRPKFIPNAVTQEELDRIQREAYFTGIPPVSGSASPIAGGIPAPRVRPVGNSVTAAKALQDAILNRPPVQR